ncbi:MAG: hypothetical protein ACK42D_01770 [Candidatus Paceibacteria bacterium]
MITKEIRNQIFETAKPAQQFLFASGKSGASQILIAKKYDLHNGEMYNKFAITVGDIILGFYKIEDTVPLLQQELGLDPRTAALLGADVLDFLAPLSDPNWQPPVEELGTEENDAEDVYKTQIPSEEGTTTTGRFTEDTTPTPYQGTEPASTVNTSFEPAYPSAVTPVASPTPPPPQPPNPALHTMASDMQTVRQDVRPVPTMNLEHTPTYISQNQDSLRQPISNTPSYTSPSQPLNSPSTSDIEPPRWSSN